MIRPDSTVDVSVIIPCHNSTGTLGLQLDALAQQVGAPPFEVIIADNGSGDGLDEFIRPWQERLNLRYVEARDRQGPAYARNVGMSVADGNLWLFCDSDDVVARDWVAEGSSALGSVEVFSGPGLRATDEELRRGLPQAWQTLDAGLAPGEPLGQPIARPWPILLGGNSGLRRDLAIEVGGYDAALSHGIEDNDLAARLQAAGHLITPAPGVRILYRERAGVGARFHSSRLSGEWHMAMCERHDLWKASPHLRGGAWRVEPLRCLANAVRMTLSPRNRDWAGLASRMGLAIGMWQGWWRFGVRKKLPGPETGIGGTASATPHPGEALVFMPGITSGGGAERYAVAMVCALAELGYDPILATNDSTDPGWIDDHFGVDLGNAKVLPLPELPAWMHALPRAIFDLLEEWSWQRTMSRRSPAVFVDCLYRSELAGMGDLSVYICHFPHRLGISYRGPRRIYMATIKLLRNKFLHKGQDFRETYDMVCANSEFTAGHIRDRWNVEPQILYPPCPAMPAMTDRLQRILVVGRMEAPVPGVPNKRLDILVSTFARMDDLHENGWELHVVGACPDRSRPYLDELKRLAGGTPVVFHRDAEYDELRALYATSTLYWHAQGYGEDASEHPETQEHFGMTTVEAMSGGTIPVVIDTAGPREVVEKVPGCGHWVTPEQLMDETRRILTLPPADLTDLSQRCQDRAREFDTPHFAQRLSDLLTASRAGSSAGPDDADWLHGRPVLVLSPHLDDALFSASEVIRSTTTEVWTVFAGEPQPALTTAWDRTCGFPDSHALMIERLDEDKRAFADTQADIRHLPYLDGAYTTPERRAADLEDLRRELSAWIEQHSGDQPIVVLPAGAGVPVADPLGDRMAHVTHRIASTPGILAPLVQPLRGLKHRLYQHRRRSAQGQGLAVNEDHRAVRDTALALLRRDPRVTVVLMEDLPYLWWHPADDAVKEAAAKNGLNATKRRLIVDRRWKNEHISEYTSQLHTMDVDQNRLAKTETLPENEYYWILNRETNPPLTVPESLQD